MEEEPKRAALKAIEKAAMAALGENLRAIIVKGSALRDDFVPGYSDLDIHVYVSSRIMRGGRTPALQTALDFQRAVGRLEPSDYGLSSFQIYLLREDAYPRDWSKPLPGDYEVVFGKGIDDASSIGERLRLAHLHLETFSGSADRLLASFVDKPDRSLPAIVRLSGIYVKGAMYAAVAVASGDPSSARLPLAGMLALLEQEGVDATAARRFFESVQGWDELVTDPERLRRTFGHAVEALDALDAWYAKVRTTQVPE